MIAATAALTYFRVMTREGNPKMVAIVDDDASLRRALEGLFKAAGLQAKTFASAEEFLDSGQQHHTGCLVTDIRMPGMSGLELQAELDSQNCKIPIIFLTAHGDAEMRMQALRAGAVEFLTKQIGRASCRERVYVLV